MEPRYISADNHLDLAWTPPNVWTDRVAPKFRDAAPHVIQTEDGAYWEWEGKRQLPSNFTPSNAASLKRFRSAGVDAPDGSLPPGDPALLLDHMDHAGIYAAVTYGPTRKWNIQDRDLLIECYRAYNDFAIEEFNASSPDRLLLLPNLPTRFPEASVEEMARLARTGVRAVEFSTFDVGVPIWDEAWEPLWELAGEAGIVICMHVGDKAGAPYPPNRRGASLAHFSCTPFVTNAAMAQIIFCGALERYPGLHVAFGECRIGWLPFFIEWMDRQYRERQPDTVYNLSMPPSEYFKRQVTVSFEDDVLGARMIKESWSQLAESAVWGADYPHNHVAWPDPEPIMEKMFEGTSPALKRRVVFDRAAEFFGIKGPVAVGA